MLAPVAGATVAASLVMGVTLATAGAARRAAPVPAGGRSGPRHTPRGAPAGRVRAMLAAVALGAMVAACSGSGGGPGASSTATGATSPSPARPGASASAASAGASASKASPACAAPLALAPAGVCAAPSAATAGAPASAGPTASGGPSPSPAARGAVPGAAPTSPVGFRVRATVVPMLFPLPATAAYRYGDGWGVPRVGVVRPYELIRGVAPDGTLLRAHGGIDILVKVGTPVLAPWSGTVIDPASRWKPWDPSRYGKVVAIESDEPTSPGYVVILVHLSTQAVKVGDHVSRGQVVGKTGITGNAAGTAPHLHLEITRPSSSGTATAA